MLLDAIRNDSIDVWISESIPDHKEISITSVKHFLEQTRVPTKEWFLFNC